MSKIIQHELDGYTVAFDVVTNQHGIITSLVFGHVWRYCQMRAGQCWASQKRLAEDLGLSRATLNKHLSILVDSGYLSVTHQEGGTNIYNDTHKVNLRTKTYVEMDEQAQNFGSGCQNNSQGVSTKLTGGVKIIDTSNTNSNTNISSDEVTISTSNNNSSAKDLNSKTISARSSAKSNESFAYSDIIDPNSVPSLDYVACNEDGIEIEKPVMTNNNIWTLATALADVTGMDFEINKGQLLKYAKQMKKASPEYILSTYGPGGAWFDQHWKGQKRQKPNLKDVAETLFSFQDNSVITDADWYKRDNKPSKRGIF